MKHLLFENLAYAVGFAIYRRDRRRFGDKLPDSHRSSVIVAAILGAAVGSKLLAWAEDPGEFVRHWHDWQFLLGGKTVVGGLLGGTAAVEWIKARLRVTLRTGDLFAIPLALGIAIGRIGCWVGHGEGAARPAPDGEYQRQPDRGRCGLPAERCLLGTHVQHAVINPHTAHTNFAPARYRWCP